MWLIRRHLFPGFRLCDGLIAVFEERGPCKARPARLVTDWPEYLDLPWEHLASTMRTVLLLDGRNWLERARLDRAGFRYLAMGR